MTQNKTCMRTWWLAGAFLLLTGVAFAQSPVTNSNPGIPWPATDALGRALPTAIEVGPLKPGRFVGIFYFLTHHGLTKNPAADEPYNVAHILAADPKAAATPTSPPWGPIGMTHYWSEPLYGYYNNADPWVLRRHAQLLADAGVDTLIFGHDQRRRDVSRYYLYGVVRSVPADP